MADLNTLTIAEAAKGLDSGDFSARELAADCLAAMERGRDLNAFITETPEIALIRADEADARRADGESKSPLDSIAIAV